MKNLLEELNVTETVMNFQPAGDTARISAVLEAEDYIRTTLECKFYENYPKMIETTGKRLDYREYRDMIEDAVVHHLVKWINKYFSSDLNPMLCSFAINAAKNTN
jgi:hypothetical protein